MRRGAKAAASWGLVFFLVFFTVPGALKSQAPGKGNLVGFVYGRDGTTPVPGAVVMVKSVTSGQVFESTKSDALGIFKVEGLGAGVYAIGVTSAQGSYNSQDFVGVAPNETAKVSIALNPYDPETAAAAQTIALDQREKGESFIGRVVKYVPAAKEAEVFVERGVVQTGDRLRFKGGATDFYQDAKTLVSSGAKAKRVLAGQSAMLPVAKTCASGDFVYVVCKRGVPPFFLAPLGIAAIVAGSAALVTIEEEEPVSQFTIRK